MGSRFDCIKPLVRERAGCRELGSDGLERLSYGGSRQLVRCANFLADVGHVLLKVKERREDWH